MARLLVDAAEGMHGGGIHGGGVEATVAAVALHQAVVHERAVLELVVVVQDELRHLDLASSHVFPQELQPIHVLQLPVQSVPPIEAQN